MQKFSKGQKIGLLLCMITIIFVSIIGAYAYIYVRPEKTIKQTADLSAGSMALRFQDGDNGINTSLTLG